MSLHRRYGPFNAIERLFFYACLFPYVSPIRMGTDLQPLSLVIAFLIILLPGSVRVTPLVKLSIYILITTFIIGIWGILVYGLTFGSIRGMFSYISFTIHVFVFSKICIDRRGKEAAKELNLALRIYAAFAILQWLGMGEFISWFVNVDNSGIAGGGRGATSLTAEPTFFALTIIMILIVMARLQRPGVLLGGFCVALSGSATGFLNYAIVLSALYREKIKMPWVIAGTISTAFALLAIAVYSYAFPTSRVSSLAGRVMNRSIAEAVRADASINDRLGSLAISASSVVESGPFPKGFNHWADYMVWYDGFLVEIFPFVTYYNGRIHSSLGAIIFELGIFGFIFVFLIGRRITKYDTGLGLVVLILMCQTVPWSHPLLALCCYVLAVPVSYRRTDDASLQRNKKASLLGRRKRIRGRIGILRGLRSYLPLTTATRPSSKKNI